MKKYIIVTPTYQKSAGVRTLHALADALLARGFEVFLFSYAPYSAKYKYITAITEEMKKNDVVVYPEIILGNPLGFQNIARYVLYFPGKLGGSTTFHPSEIIFVHDPLLGDDPVLGFPLINKNIFYRDETPKTHNAYFVYKGGEFHEIPEIANAIRIDMHYPTTQEDLANLLRSTRVLYSFDANSSLLDEAVCCGAQVKLITENDIVDYDSKYESNYLPEKVEHQLDVFIEKTQALNYQGDLEPSEAPYHRRVYFKARAVLGKLLGNPKQYYRYRLRY